MNTQRLELLNALAIAGVGIASWIMFVGYLATRVSYPLV
jgi:hypothetical protein